MIIADVTAVHHLRNAKKFTGKIMSSSFFVYQGILRAACKL